MSRKRIVDLTTGEIQEEINARADARVESLLHNDVVIRHPFSRYRVYTPVGESMTHQSHAESCDINSIIRQFDRTGLLPPIKTPPVYADVTNLQGKELTELINDAEAAKEQLRLDRAASAAAAKAKVKESEATPSSPSPTKSAVPPKEPVAPPPPAGIEPT